MTLDTKPMSPAALRKLMKRALIGCEFRRAYDATEARVRSSGGQLVRPSEVAAC